MSDAAPRISPRLVRAIERIDDGERPIADICRAAGATAERLRLPRPSYEQVRVLVHRQRRWNAAHPSTASVLVDVAWRVKPPTAVLDHISGTS
jgi:hypothetical protein